MGHRVLCVDPDPGLCQVVARALEGAGFSVDTEVDGERALARVGDDPPDLLLLDLFTPGRDGFELLDAVRELPEPARNLPAVMLSACSVTPEYERRAAALGAAALLRKPVPLAELTSVVAGILGEPKPSLHGEKSAPKTPALTGSLDRTSFAALLHHLHGLRATGVLQLQTGRKRKWLQLREGYPTAVRSNLEQECLGNFLVRAGRIDDDVLHESHRQMRSGKPQGQILVAMEVLSEEEVSDALREHAEAKLYEIFGWTDGRFRFEFGATLPRASGLAAHSPANLILRGVRTRMPLERVDAWYEQNAGSELVRSESPFYRFQSVSLEHEQRRLVETLEPGRPLSEFASADQGTRRTLFGLVCTGFLEIRDAGSAPQEARGPARIEAPSAPREAEEESASPERAHSRLTELAQQFEGATPFQILGVEMHAGPDEIRAAYERLAAESHPDCVSGEGDAVRRLAEEVYASVQEAYETLSDPGRARRYVLERKREEREDQAREERRRAVEADRAFEQGETSLKARDYEGALDGFGRALQLFPEEGEYHSHYGWTLHLCHPDDATMTDEALEHCKRGIKLAADREKPYLLMGRLCKAMGRVGPAERMFHRAVSIQPDCVEALRELRLINMRRTKQRKGILGRLLKR